MEGHHFPVSDEPRSEQPLKLFVGQVSREKPRPVQAIARVERSYVNMASSLRIIPLYLPQGLTLVLDLKSRG